MREPPFPEEAARRAIAGGLCWADALRALGYMPVGHNIRTLQRWVARWAISTDHFDPNVARRRANLNRRVPLAEVLTENSSYRRGALKPRLFEEGLKVRRCELCGQDEHWQGKRLALVLDHINGVSDDHRLENLQIVCPNCAATLDTHCGRNLPRERRCVGCAAAFEPRNLHHRYCSPRCFSRTRAANAGNPSPVSTFGIPRPHTRKVNRPPHDDLLREIDETSYVAVGRKYGVSDVAIRKWVRFYEREAERKAAEAENNLADAA
jgi:hypothetical protein